VPVTGWWWITTPTSTSGGLLAFSRANSSFGKLTLRDGAAALDISGCECPAEARPGADSRFTVTVTAHVRGLDPSHPSGPSRAGNGEHESGAEDAA
jgi:hypothetical protein